MRSNKLLYKIDFPLIRGKFVKKLNRFVLVIKINGKNTKVYMPNPGRLATILTPGRTILLKEKETGKYKYEVFAAKMNDFYATLDPKLANLLFKKAIEKDLLKEFKRCKMEKEEVKTKIGRLDFLLSYDGKKHLVEVKSCTHVEDGVAKFPDRQTERGRRHLQHLMKTKNSHLVIVVQRPDARKFKPYREIDSEFADLFEKALKKRKTSVTVFCTKFEAPNIYFERAVNITV